MVRPLSSFWERKGPEGTEACLGHQSQALAPAWRDQDAAWPRVLWACARERFCRLGWDLLVRSGLLP